MNKVFVIDDDIAILELIKINLELSGYNVQTSSDPIKGFQMIKQENPDLIILDVMMPEVDGYSLALKIRQQDATKKIPIIMLTALGELDDKLKGFNSGVDDYLTKPFEIEELKARVLAVLNRSGRAPESLRYKELLSLGDITLIPESYTVKILDKETKLTPIEFDILNCLMQHNNEMVSAKTLLKEVWGYNDNDEGDTIRVHIRHLRSKLDKISTEKNKYIETIYGGGYRLIPDGVKMKSPKSK